VLGLGFLCLYFVPFIWQVTDAVAFIILWAPAFVMLFVLSSLCSRFKIQIPMCRLHRTWMHPRMLSLYTFFGGLLLGGICGYIWCIALEFLIVGRSLWGPPIAMPYSASPAAWTVVFSSGILVVLTVYFLVGVAIHRKTLRVERDSMHGYVLANASSRYAEEVDSVIAGPDRQ
jgi:hypothetical protein